MNLIRTAAWVCAAGLLVTGEAQTGPRAIDPIAVNAQAQNRPLRGENAQPSDREWSDVLSWMEQHSPNRLNFLKHMKANQTQLLQAKQLIWNEYLVVQRVNYPPLKKALVTQAEAQDQVFGAQIALREAQRATAEDQEAARASLKSAVGRLVDGEQTVIQTRIEKLGRDLDRLKENHDKRVEQIYRTKLRQANGLKTQDAAPPPQENQPSE